MIPDSEIKRLLDLANCSRPLEMCGLMFSDNSFEDCWNVHPDPRHGFEIAYEEYLSKVSAYGESPWATVHSHPHGPATISGRDMKLLDALELADNPMKMVIVGLKPMQIRIYAKVEGQYKVEWAWDVKPFQSTGVLYATNS